VTWPSLTAPAAAAAAAADENDMDASIRRDVIILQLPAATATVTHCSNQITPARETAKQFALLRSVALTHNFVRPTVAITNHSVAYCHN